MGKQKEERFEKVVEETAYAKKNRYLQWLNNIAFLMGILFIILFIKLEVPLIITILLSASAGWSGCASRWCKADRMSETKVYWRKVT